MAGVAVDTTGDVAGHLREVPLVGAIVGCCQESAGREFGNDLDGAFVLGPEGDEPEIRVAWFESDLDVPATFRPRRSACGFRTA